MSSNLTKVDTFIDCNDPNDQWNDTIIKLVSTAKNSRNKKTQFEAVKDIRKITSENENLIDLLIKHRAIPVLVEKCEVGNPTTKLQALWALSNITSGTSEQTSMVSNKDNLKILNVLTLFI